MSLAHQSIATISSPEFINLQPLDINPLMSSCEIKVFYLGGNRNGSYITKDVATEMAKTLRGAPIVGYYKEDREDFLDHGDQVIFDGEGVHFKTLTKPYGFVSPDAKVWFQDFEDTDEFGNTVTRTYMMTTGYLWTGQYEEAATALDGGRPQSMEIDEKSLQGHWATDSKNNMEFFIINDAIFSKLCILGNDIQPCFEGAGITTPEVSKTFTLDETFKHTLFTMMEELKYALKGGNTVADVKNLPVEDQNQVQPETTFTANETNDTQDSSSSENANAETSFENAENTEPTSENFAKKDDQEDDKEDKPAADDKEDDAEDDADDKEDADEEKKKKYSALENSYNELKADFDALENEVKELRLFKHNIEMKQKDDLIDQFYMLSEADKKEVVENKEKYTLDEIKSKLAVICFEKKVNFNLENSSNFEEEKKETEEPVTTFNIKDTEDSIPEWVRRVESNL